MATAKVTIDTTELRKLLNAYAESFRALGRGFKAMGVFVRVDAPPIPWQPRAWHARHDRTPAATWPAADAPPYGLTEDTVRRVVKGGL